jgi:Domain of unknown function (DUF4438)
MRGLRANVSRLVTVTVSGQIAHPVAPANPYRIGADGIPRVLPGTGGIVNLRIGDLCIGLAGDHIEPGVALHNNGREVTGPRNGPNNALLTYSCVGNRALVLNGPCRGKVGLVTGKHGGVNHVLVDFPTNVLRRLRIGDRLSIESRGLGLRLLDHPRVELFNCSPELLERWRLAQTDGRLHVPVTHRIPAALMGSGLGRNTAWRGDYDIQLADAPMAEKHRLGSLRFGDLVAVVDSSTRHGPSHRGGQVTVGVVVHGDSTVSGHGPGVTPLMSAPATALHLHRDPNANLAALFGLRTPATPRFRRTLIDAERRARLHEAGRVAPQVPAQIMR